MNEEKKKQVIALGQLGWSLRQIEKATGIRRETAAGYLRAAGIGLRPPRGWGKKAPPKPANGVTTDSPEAKPANGVTTDPAPDVTAEVPAPETLVYQASTDQGKPIVSCGEESEDARHRHDQVEVRDDKICVVQILIENRLGKDRTSQPAGNE